MPRPRSRLTDWAVGVVGIAMVSTILLPRRNSTAQILQAMGDANATAIRSAMGGPFLGNAGRCNNAHCSLHYGGPYHICNSAADDFAERAAEAIGDFWRGFGE